MLKLFIKYFMIVSLASFVGFCGVHYFIYQTLPWSGDMQLQLTINIKGTRNQGVANAKLFLLAPDKKNIGVTDKNGDYFGFVTAKKGKIAVLLAEGPTFKITKDIPIPRSNNFHAIIELSPKEAELGHMILISKAIEDMSKNLGREKKKVQPVIKAKSGIIKSDDIGIIIRENSPIFREQLNYLSPILQEAILKQKMILQQLGVRSIEVRCITATEVFFEVKGLGDAGNIVSSVLIRASPIKPQSVFNAINALIRKVATGAATGGVLSVQSSNPNLIRAYLNGIALKGNVVSANSVEFALLNIALGGSHVALAVTADDRPLIRRIMPRETMTNNLQWTLPDPAFSMIKSGSVVR